MYYLDVILAYVSRLDISVNLNFMPANVSERV